MSNIQSRPARNGRSMQRRPAGGGSNNNNGRRLPSGGGRGPSNGGSGRRPGSEMNVGQASASRDRYLEKAREALSFGDRVMAENFFQHADHYNRIIIAAEERRSDEPYYKKEAHEPHQLPAEQAANNIEQQVALETENIIAAAIGLGFDDALPEEFPA
jgi:hypothetical protein